jgi:hypothetical protein
VARIDSGHLGICEDGRKSRLGLMAGSKGDVETARAFFQDLRVRGLGDPLLVVCDGAPAIIRGIEERFSRSMRQRCQAHRLGIPESLGRRGCAELRIETCCSASTRRETRRF